MAKTRLRNDDRDAICAAIIGHKFEPLLKAMTAEEAALAVRVRREAYGAFLSVMEKAPEGAFGSSKTLRVNVSGWKIGLSLSGEARLFYNHARGWDEQPILTTTEDTPLGAEIKDFAQRKDQIKTERSDLHRATRATLGNFHSFDDLLAEWPAAEQFIRARWQTRPDYVANVPAVQIADLSAKLDLPPDDQLQAA